MSTFGIEQIILIILSLIICYLFYIIMVPFWTPLLWAIVIVILFYPLHNKLKKRYHLNDVMGPLVTCIAIGVFLTIPVLLLSITLVQEVVSLYTWLETYLRESTIRFHNSPIFLTEYIQKILGRYIEISNMDIKDILLKGLKETSNYIINNLTAVISNFTRLTIDLVMTFFTMYYLFKDGDKIVEYLKGLLPLSEKNKNAILKKSKEVIYATLYGGVLVAVMQGALGGLSFWIVGLSAPVLWGTVMAIFAFLPVIGTPAVWIPIAIYFFIKVSYMKGIVVILSGILIVVLGDILRPIIISSKTDIHPLLLLFSIFGGIETIGIIGVIAGPIILSIVLTMIDMYEEGYLTKENIVKSVK